MIFRTTIVCVFTMLAVASGPVADLAAQEASKQRGDKPAGGATSAIEGGEPRYIRPETPEQRKERLGTVEDPGPNPDDETIWWRFGKKFKIVKFDKRWARPTERPGWVKPQAFANFADELYQENDKYVWVWLEQTDPEPQLTEEEVRQSRYQKLDEKQIAFLNGIVDEYTPVEVPKTDVTVRFENASNGLPREGSWRNSLAAADMNGDGKIDLVLPPQRGATSGLPSIYLGDGKGNWEYWQQARFERRLDYGSVVAADFNRDRKMDLAFGVHLSGVVLVLGDGKGNFREVLRTDDFATRRVVATDVDADGWTDLVAISEGPVMRGKALKDETYANLRAYMNKKGKSFEGANLSGPKDRVSGDWLVAGNFNGDRFPDFAGSSLYYSAVEMLYVSKGKPAEYELIADSSGKTVPFFSYYTGVTAGRFSSRDREDAVVTFTRRWVPRIDPDVVPPPPHEKVIGLDRITFEGGQAKRVPVVRWGDEDAIWITGINSGDFNGDGNDDIIYARGDQRRFYLLLGDGRGGFREAKIAGLELGSQRHYDLAVADVNGDERPDVIMMYEAQSGTSFAPRNGKVEVFINRGVAKK